MEGKWKAGGREGEGRLKGRVRQVEGKWKGEGGVKMKGVAGEGGYGPQGSCVEKEIMQGTMSGARRRGRPRTAWLDNIKTSTGLSVEESVRMTEDRDKWRKYVHGVPTVGLRTG